jgi:hypothetical protein
MITKDSSQTNFHCGVHFKNRQIHLKRLQAAEMMYARLLLLGSALGG